MTAALLAITGGQLLFWFLVFVAILILLRIARVL